MQRLQEVISSRTQTKCLTKKQYYVKKQMLFNFRGGKKCLEIKMHSGGPYLPVKDELGSVVGRQRTKWMWEEKKQKIKRNRRRKIMAGRFDHRHPVRVSCE